MVNSMLTEDDAELVADLMGTVCLQKNRPLVVVAKGYDASIRSLFYANKQIKKDLPILPIDIAIQGKENLEKFDDLAISLGAVPYDKLGGEVLEKFDHNRLGSCAKVISTDISTKFIEGHGNPKSIEARINYIKERLEELELLDDHIDCDDEIRDLKKRIASLSQSMAIIYVGGETQTERDTKKFLIEDAVYAVKSALEYGYIVGGNLTLPRILNNENYIRVIKEELSEKMNHIEPSKRISVITETLLAIKKSFINSFDTVLKNSSLSKEQREAIIGRCLREPVFYNLKRHEFESDEETVVINSAETDIEIIKACFSIIGLLVTSNQFLSLNAIK